MGVWDILGRMVHTHNSRPPKPSAADCRAAADLERASVVRYNPASGEVHAEETSSMFRGQRAHTLLTFFSFKCQ